MSQTENNRYIFELLTSYFKARHFQVIPTDLPGVAMFAIYQKSSLYLINLVSLDDDYAFDYDRYQAFRADTRKQFSKIRSDQVILLNIMILDDPERVYKYVDYTPNLEEDFVDIHWLIDSKEKELVIPNRQINSVMGLEKPIRELVTTGKHEFYELTRLREESHISFFFILLNVAIWIFLEFNGGSTNIQTLMHYGALNGNYMVATGEFWRLLTSMFLHIGFGHLAYNVFALYIFGSRLEKYINTTRFILIYLSSGIIGALFSFAASLLLGSNVVSAGASGAIYGLLGAVLVLSKASGQSMEGLNSHTLWLIFIFGMVFSVISPNIDVFAHVGGFAGGLISSMPIIYFDRKQLAQMKKMKHD